MDILIENGKEGEVKERQKRKIEKKREQGEGVKCEMRKEIDR